MLTIFIFSLIIFTYPHVQVKINYSLCVSCIPHSKPLHTPRVLSGAPFPTTSPPIRPLPTSATQLPAEIAHNISPCTNLTYSSKSSSNITSSMTLFLNSSYHKPFLPSLNFFVSHLADIGYSGRKGL